MAGIYIHIPFCHSKCAYCDFYSMPNTSRLGRLAAAIQAEYDMRAGELGSDHIETLYLGGGTPSIVPVELLGSLLEHIPAGSAREVTLEANPEDITSTRAAAWAGLGVNRLSIGVQSMVDSELAAIGRRHNSSRVCEAVAAIREQGFDNFNLDLIYGLPGQDIESWKWSVYRVLSLEPTHISAYSLTYEPRTRLTAMLRQGKIQQMSDDDVVNLYRYACNRLRDAGYEHYEISNWAKPGYRALHNSSYWHAIPYLGLGPAAHSYDGTARRINPSNLSQYLHCIEGGRPACCIEPEDDANVFNDMLITGLRTAEGLDLGAINETRHRQLMRDALPYIRSGHLDLVDNRLKFHEDSWLISDYVMEHLIQLS